MLLSQAKVVETILIWVIGIKLTPYVSSLILNLIWINSTLEINLRIELEILLNLVLVIMYDVKNNFISNLVN